MNLLSRKELHQFRKYNNRFERELRKTNLWSIDPAMNPEQIISVVNDNKTALFSSSIKQFDRHPDLFKKDLDFGKMDLVENIKYPERTTLIIKVTHACNLHCPYCYDLMYRKSLNAEGNLLTIDTVKQILKVFKELDIGQWIWHGGEPLLVDNVFYEEANSLINEQFPKASIDMQSNLVLLNDEKARMLKKWDVRPGFSFDGLTNHLTRKNTGDLMRSLLVAERNGIFSGAIMLITSDNINQLIDEYEYFKRLRLHCKMNLIFAANKNDKTYNLDGKLAAEKLCDFFDYWIKDTQGPVSSDICERYLFAALDAGGSCSFTDCAGENYWFSVQPNGDIYHCGRDWPEENSLSFGNIFDVESVSDIIEHPNHKRWYEGTRRMLKNCSSCDFFYSCHSGCYNDNVQYDPSLNKPEPSNCYLHKHVISHIIKTLNEIDFDDMPSYNPIFLNFLFKFQFRSAKMLNNILDESIRQIEVPVKAEDKLKEFLVG
ncbi:MULTISPECIES: radical SAM protein [unclassified Dehalobacter]|jgi:Arylsulfatase regulator (Fe-S oxidoreductase)|uniref:radical SAM/SPASM domain-containing protein n=1 Tax=unclassified Dehalobacter TaxID=2635733 RepID=UPI00028A4CE0|nr:MULTISPECIES: radical SAM protein [unclassified Dehalobacter]AFV01140.1 Putative arylsulfatase regulatory protein [Dehalobacter sp. DCA]AFV04184.1 Putative arylsulfatase regulatory protein [Dehalobacter sp. CF]